MKLAILRGNSRDILSQSIYNAVKVKDLLVQEYFLDTDVEIVRVFLDDYNIFHNAFDVCWKFENELFVVDQDNIQPNMIRNMCPLYSYYVHELLAWYTVVCSRHVALLCDDKYTTYQFLWKRQPYTVLLQDFLNHESIRDNFWNNIVTKPIYGSKGTWVELYTKEELMTKKKELESFWQTVIVQQALNVSNWYKDLIHWRHDLRIYMSWKLIIDALVRQQKSWSSDFRVSVALWWRAIPLDKEEIPQELVEIIEEIVQVLAPKPYDFYSLDFMFDSNEEEWYLIEANSVPWFRNERQIKNIKEDIILKGIEAGINFIKWKDI